MIQFSPVCTLPDEAPAFIGAPNVRSTLSIVWTCISVLILCTWSILHLTVPEQFKPKTWRQRWNLKVARTAKKIKWMFLTLIAPELIFANAVASLQSIRTNTPRFRELAREDGVEWSRAHTALADMGGFVIKFPPDETDDASTGTDDGERHLQDWELEAYARRSGSSASLYEPSEVQKMRDKVRRKMVSRSQWYGQSVWRPCKQHEADMDFSAAVIQQQITLLLLEGDTWALSAAQLLQVREMGIISRLPNVTEADIEDKNKGDLLVKLLAIVQVVWMVAQVIVRLAQGRASAPLEIMSLAYAACAFLFYLLALDRPQGITTPIIVPAQRTSTLDERNKLGQGSNTFAAESYGWHNYGARITNDGQDGQDDEDLSFFVGGVLGALVFGGLHLVAWNSSFPSETERWLWRAAALVTMLAPAVFMVLIIYMMLALDAREITPDVAIRILSVSCSILLLLARLVVFFEAFRSLYYLPPDGFVNTWADNIPHFG